MNGVRVVIADDDAYLVRLLEHQITSAGYPTETCANGSDALELLAGAETTVLLADWEMPGLTGIELCRHIRATRASDGVYIILLTANAEPHQIAVGLDAGADDYLVKPVAAPELLARIRSGERILNLLVQQREHTKRLEIEIAERERAELQQRRFVHAVEAAAEAIVLTDLGGRILQVNPAFAEITGYSAEEAVGQTPRVVKSGRQDEAFYRRLWSQISSGRVWSGRIVNRRKDDSIYNAELTIAPFADASGKIAGYVGVQRDVSDQVKREEEIEQARTRAEEALRNLEQAHVQLLQSDKMASIGQLAAGVAHEINNPMGFITSNLNSLADYLGDLKEVLGVYDDLLRELEQGSPCPKEKLDNVRQVREAKDIDFVVSDLDALLSESVEGAKRVRQIVADLRDFSHVDTPDVAEEDINGLLDKTINVAWNELKYKTEVIREYGDVSAIPCYGGKLGQVFLNLLVNAAHAIEERGTVTIRTSQSENEVSVEVSDTGCGIPPENLKRIFDPFFTTKEVGKGTGMGLNLAYKIVEAHGGRISAESTIGEGTTFRVDLPKVGPPEPKEAASEPVS